MKTRQIYLMGLLRLSEDGPERWSNTARSRSLSAQFGSLNHTYFEFGTIRVASPSARVEMQPTDKKALLSIAGPSQHIALTHQDPFQSTVQRMPRSIMGLALSLIGMLGFSQQHTLEGRASIHNSGYETGAIQYVQDTYLTAPFATADNTDEEGRFHLTFVGMEFGTTVRVQAEKTGLEVVNAHDLEQVVIGRRDPLPIYLAEKGMLAQAQTELYQISKKALYAQRDALIAQLRSKDERREAAMAELQKRLGKEVQDRFQAEDLLNERIADLERRLPSVAQTLTTQNLDFASELYITAYERYKVGDIEGAVALLDSTALIISYNEARATLKEGQRLDSISSDLLQKGRRQLRQAIDSYALKAEGLALLFDHTDAAEQYQQIITIYKENDLDSLELAEWYDRLGETYYDGGRYLKALDLCQRALSLRKEILHPGHLDLATSYSNIAIVYHSLGKYLKAEEYHQRAIAVREKVLDPKHPDLATSYDNIAIVYRSFGEYQRALEYHQRALVTQEEVLDVKDLDLVASYTNIASTYHSLGEYQTALEYLQRAIGVQEEVLGPNHLDVATSYNNIAMVYHSLGKYKEAMKYQQRGITILKEVLNPNHPDLATSYHNTAGTYRSLGEYSRALEYHRKGIAIEEEVLGSGHPHLAISYDNAALTYGSLGEYWKALEYHQRALAIREEVLDPKHPELATSYNNIAMAYHSLGKYKEAMRYQQRGIAIDEEVLDPKHPDLAISYDNAALTYGSLGDSQKALEYYQRALAIREKVLDPKHPDLAISYNNAAIVYRSLGEYQKALEYHQRAITIQEEVLGPKHPRLANSYNSLGNTYGTMGTSDKALTYLEKALSIRKEVLPAHHPDLATSHHDMGACLYDVRWYGAALEHLAKALVIRRETLPKDHPDLVETFSSLGLAYAKDGQLEQTKKALEEYEELSPDKGEAHRNWALYHALTGDQDKALASLQRAIELGYDDITCIEKEEAFKGLRDMEAYKELIERSKVESEE